MRLEKHIESLKEVMDEIKSSLEDLQGIKSHQRRLAIMLPLGVCELIELYFHKLKIIKNGSRIKHNWFRQKRARDSLSNQIIIDIEDVKNIDKIIDLAQSIEEKRDDMAYGSPIEEESLLKSKIDDFLELKKIIEGEIGDIIGK